MLVIAMTVLLGTTVGWAKAPPASTAATCGAKLIASLPIKNGGKRIGSLVVYRSGGTTCAMTKHGGASWGKQRFTSIMLVGCKTKKAGKDCGEAPYKQDKGQVRVPGGAGPGDERQAVHLGTRRPGHRGRQADHHRRDRPEVPRALLRLDVASLASRERRR